MWMSGRKHIVQQFGRVPCFDLQNALLLMCWEYTETATGAHDGGALIVHLRRRKVTHASRIHAGFYKQQSRQQVVCYMDPGSKSPVWSRSGVPLRPAQASCSWTQMNGLRAAVCGEVLGLRYCQVTAGQLLNPDTSHQVLIHYNSVLCRLCLILYLVPTIIPQGENYENLDVSGFEDFKITTQTPIQDNKQQ